MPSTKTCVTLPIYNVGKLPIRIVSSFNRSEFVWACFGIDFIWMLANIQKPRVFAQLVSSLKLYVSIISLLTVWEATRKSPAARYFKHIFFGSTLLFGRLWSVKSYGFLIIHRFTHQLQKNKCHRKKHTFFLRFFFSSVESKESIGLK